MARLGEMIGGDDPSVPRDRVIYVFVKDPYGDQPVKTRLAPLLGAAGARALAAALLEDVLAGAARTAGPLAARLVVACAPDRPSPALRGLARRHGAELVGQGPGSLGARLARVLELAGGATRVALGADVPDLPRGRLGQAVAAVEGGSRAALGPALDGGYHLLALSAGLPAGFLRDGSIAWGSERALEGTRVALARAGVAATLLDPWPDVDEPGDLRRFLERSQGAREEAPATRAWAARWARGLGPAWLDSGCPRPYRPGG